MTTTDLPYAGTSGWSGSDTSRERAEREDSNGTTSNRQAQTLDYLNLFPTLGSTWKELASARGWHHGQASGTLSVLHKAGRVARLHERRDRCAVYVLPEHVQGRPTAPHGRRKNHLTEQEESMLRSYRRLAAVEVANPKIASITISMHNLRRLMALVDHLSE